MNKSEQNIQELFKVWYWHFTNPSIQQFSNLYTSTSDILNYFISKTDSQNKEHYKEFLENRLPKLFFHPLPTIKETWEDFPVKTKAIDWAIPQLEWVYFRDTKYKIKLGRSYYLDDNSRKQKELLLSEILLILSVFKQELSKIRIEVMIKEDVGIYIPLPSGNTEIKQIGSESE